MKDFDASSEHKDKCGGHMAGKVTLTLVQPPVTTLKSVLHLGEEAHQEVSNRPKGARETDGVKQTRINRMGTSGKM